MVLILYDRPFTKEDCAVPSGSTGDVAIICFCCCLLLEEEKANAIAAVERVMAATGYEDCSR
jgi:hypothetical protein